MVSSISHTTFPDESKETLLKREGFFVKKYTVDTACIKRCTF